MTSLSSLCGDRRLGIGPVTLAESHTSATTLVIINRMYRRERFGGLTRRTIILRTRNKTNAKATAKANAIRTTRNARFGRTLASVT